MGEEHRLMSPRRLLAAGAALTIGLTIGGVAAAGAETAPVTGGSWYSATQPAPPANTVQLQSTSVEVPKGDFAVGLKNGSSDKETYLHIDTSSIPAGSTVSSFTLTLTEDSSGANQTAAHIKAVPVTEFFADGAQGNPYGQQPPTAPSPSVMGQRGPDGRWTFDLAPIVQAWVSGSMGNNGVAFLPVAQPSPVTVSDSWEVVWRGDPAPVAQGSATPPAPAFENSGSSGAAASSSSLSSGGSSVPSSFSQPSALAAPAPVTTPSAAPAPSGTTTPEVALPVTRPSAPAVASRTKHGLDPRAIPAALVFLALLGGASLALGDRGEPAPARQGSVVRRLERRPSSASATSLVGLEQ
jgi:hypothetical protein